jgi:hypothetical protein
MDISKNIATPHASHQTGWETLANRRETRRLTTLYKIHNKLCPPYLFNCLPPVTSDVNSYNLRNNQKTMPKPKKNVWT